MASESGVLTPERIGTPEEISESDWISGSYASREEQRESMKREIRDKIKSLRDKLDAVECKLLAEVDRLIGRQISDHVELEAKLKTLKEGKANLEKLKENIELTSSIELAIKDLDRKMIKTSQELNQFQEIKSSWETAYWDTCGSRSYLSRLSRVGDICQLSNVKITYSVYESKLVPLWQIPYGYNPSQLISPNGIAIQETSDVIYVSDTEGKRIQVFSKTGEHIRLIDLTTNPIQILFMKYSNIYGIYRFEERNILTEIKLDDDTVTVQFVNCPITTADKFASGGSGRFFTFSQGDSSTDDGWLVNRISESSKSDLYNLSDVQQNSVSMVEDLHSITINGRIVDIVTMGDMIYVLVSNSQYLVLKFSDNFELECPICPSSLLGVPRAICVDRKGNVIIAGHKKENILRSTSSSDSDPIEDETTMILIFTPQGELVRRMTHTSGNCVGLAVNSEFDIFVLNNDTSYPLSCL